MGHIENDDRSEKDSEPGPRSHGFSPVHVSSSREGKGTWESDELKHDLEENRHLKPPDDSYAGLAILMNGNSDVAIVRRFGDLNAQNLLYLQAELVSLENKLREQEYHDRHYGKEDEKGFHRDYVSLAQHKDSAQHILMAKLRTKLQEYNQALQHQHFLSSLPGPSRYDLRWLRRWLRDRRHGARFITSDDADVYEPLSKHGFKKLSTSSTTPNKKNRPTMEDDLVGLGIGGPKDPFSKWVINGLLVAWHRTFGQVRSHAKIVSVNEDPALRLVSMASTVVASLLPVAVVFVLHALPTDPQYVRLAAFAAFTVVFALLMMLFTGAKRSEIFAAAAAFAAVQVVFIGTTNDHS